MLLNGVEWWGMVMHGVRTLYSLGGFSMYITTGFSLDTKFLDFLLLFDSGNEIHIFYFKS